MRALDDLQTRVSSRPLYTRPQFASRLDDVFMVDGPAGNCTRVQERRTDATQIRYDYISIRRPRVRETAASLGAVDIFDTRPRP